MYNVIVKYENGIEEITTGLCTYEWARKTAKYWEDRAEWDTSIKEIKITQD